MSDRFSVSITIGGSLKRSHLPELLKAITEAQVALGWGDAVFAPSTAKELLTAIRKGKLWFCDDAARDGEFQPLEQTCRRLSLSYTRSSSSGAECDAEVVDWRPGMKRPFACHGSDYSNATYISAEQVKTIGKHLEAGRIGQAKRLLRALCPEITRLPAFKIV